MFRMKTLFLVLAFIFSGCSRDPYASYIGLWQLQDSGAFPQVLQITKDGDTYLADENILRTTDFFGNKKKSMVLKKSEGQLAVDTGMGSAQLGLSADKNTLHAMNQEYKKISSDTLEKIKAKIDQDRIAAQKNSELCKTLNDGYVQEKSKLVGEYRNIVERSKQERELGQKYLAKAKEIPNCTLMAWIGF